jgi:sulfate adenylyltransferase
VPSPHNATTLIAPYGGTLVDLRVGPGRRQELIREAAGLPSIQLSPRALCDFELLATGALSPVAGFLGEDDYRSVLDTMRLRNGVLFPIPVTLPVEEGRTLLGKRIALRSLNNHLLAVMRVEEAYECDRQAEAEAVCGTGDMAHPFAAEVQTWGRFNIRGPLEVIDLPAHQGLTDLRRTPAQVRSALLQLGFSDVVAFHSRTPLSRVHEEITKRAAAKISGGLLLHPSVGVVKPGDLEHYLRIQTYRKVYSRYYDPRRTLFSVLPLAMRMDGPREAVWHAIIERNYGANHVILSQETGDFSSRTVPAAAAIEAVQAASRETGVQPVVVEDMVYLPDENRFEEAGRAPNGRTAWAVSGRTVSQEYLDQGRPLPEWYARREAAEILAKAYPPRQERGFCLWFTGLPSAGKSTIAEMVSLRLMEQGRRVTLLDGDVVRTHLSRGLGFSREDRDANIRRIGFVSAEIVRHNGAVICAAVSPYEATRAEVRRMVGDERFILVYVSTPVEVCEQRDVKGFYAKARAGKISGFTGVDDPYEPPPQAEIELNTISSAPEEDAQRVVDWLVEHGFLARP